MVGKEDCWRLGKNAPSRNGEMAELGANKLIGTRKVQVINRNPESEVAGK